MKRFSPALLLFVLSINTNASSPAGSPSQADIDSAKAAVKTFAGELQKELKAAMQTGGPVAAIEVCNTRALPIAESVSAGQGMNLSRVSLKNRNPMNAPNDWQASVLQGFEDQKAEGADVQSLGWAKTVETDQGSEFRFMKAIPTGGLCLACHGTSISPEVSRKLAELYPEDKATGFREGDIRGAFVVTRKIPD